MIRYTYDQTDVELVVNKPISLLVPFIGRQATSPVLQTSSRAPAGAASPVTLCATVRTTAATARTRWRARRPPAAPVSSSVETPLASRPAGCVTTTSTAR